MKSHNILYIESIDIQPLEEGMFTVLYADLNYKFQLLCPVTGNKFREIEFRSRGKGIDYIEAFRNMVQNMLNGRLDMVEPKIYNVDFDCEPHNNINHLEIRHLPDEWQQLFKKLFDITKWNIEKMGLPEYGGCGWRSLPTCQTSANFN